MGLLDNIYDSIAQAVYDRINNLNEAAKKQRKYYVGSQTKQLKIPFNKTDDNIIVNQVGVLTDRSVSRVLKGGVIFDLPDATEGEVEGEQVASDQQTYIDDVWEINKKEILLRASVLKASVYGTGYIKIVPDKLVNPYTGNVYPRLVALNPEYLTINTDPQDQERVISYVIQYTIGDTAYRETTRLARADDYETPPEDFVTWIIINEKMEGGRPWEVVGKVEWPYDFPNIVHWQNLQSIDGVYGSADADDILEMQDKANATLSYIQKQVRLQQFKQQYSSGVGNENLNVGPDTMIKLSNPDAKLGVLDMQTDITGSLAYSNKLNQLIANVAREVDISSVVEKFGNVTNFIMRVIYSDALDKNDDKRMLFGEALIELNRRLLVLAGYEGELSRPGEIVWSDPLPVNLVEKFQAQAEELAMGTVDKQTIAEENGRDWEEIQARISEQKSANDNGIGAALLRAFPGMGQANQTQPNQTQPIEKGME